MARQKRGLSFWIGICLVTLAFLQYIQVPVVSENLIKFFPLVGAIAGILLIVKS